MYGEGWVAEDVKNPTEARNIFSDSTLATHHCSTRREGETSGPWSISLSSSMQCQGQQAYWRCRSETEELIRNLEQTGRVHITHTETAR
jgi:hypothetical protein